MADKPNPYVIPALGWICAFFLGNYTNNVQWRGETSTSMRQIAEEIKQIKEQNKDIPVEIAVLKNRMNVCEAGIARLSIRAGIVEESTTASGAFVVDGRMKDQK